MEENDREGVILESAALTEEQVWCWPAGRRLKGGRISSRRPQDFIPKGERRSNPWAGYKYGAAAEGQSVGGDPRFCHGTEDDRRRGGPARMFCQRRYRSSAAAPAGSGY